MLFHIILWVAGVGFGAAFGVVVVITMLSVVAAKLWDSLR